MVAAYTGPSFVAERCRLRPVLVPRPIWFLVMFAPCVVVAGCSTRVAGPESRCDREARTKTQTLAMTKEMCVGAPIPDASAAAPAADSPPEPPVPPPAPPPDASGSASPEAGPPEAPAAPEAPPAPEPPPPPAAAAPAPPSDSKLLDPAQCDIDCTKACGGVPDAICKRVGDKEVECTLAGPSFPGC